MGGDGQHQVVVALVHQLDPRAHGLPERGQPLHRLGEGRIVGDCRGQDGPAVVEQLREARVRAGEFGAGDGVAGDHEHALWRRLCHGLADRALHRADIGQGGAGLEPRGAGPGHGADRAGRRGQQDQVRVLHSLGRIGDHFIGDAQLDHALAHGGAGVADDDGLGRAVDTGGPHHGRADQAAADHRQSWVHRVGHGWISGS